jgi:DNA polymerase-3 subunit beta
MPGIIIPRKTVGELQKLVDNPDVAVTVELSDAKIRFTIGAVVLTSKLIDGTFPDYQRVIPTGNDKDMTVDRQTFAPPSTACRRSRRERGRAVKLALADGQMTLTVNNPDSGSDGGARRRLFADPMEIGFNAKLPARHHQPARADDVFTLADPGSPTLVATPPATIRSTC